MRTPNAYERAALREIAAFRAEVFPAARAGERSERAEAAAADEAAGVGRPHPAGWPGIVGTHGSGAALVRAASRVRRALGGLRDSLLRLLATPMRRAADEACAPARAERVTAAFQRAGYAGVRVTADIQHLSLHEVERVAAGIRRRHTLGAAIVGAAAGALGGPGAIAEAPAIVSLALRAIVDCARHHGFDVRDETERAFVLDVLGVATAPTPQARRSALEHATKLIWPPATAAAPPSSGVVAARVLGRRVAQAGLFMQARKRLGRATPLLTAALGAGLNARYIYRVATVASLLYRERFLIRRCGPAMVALCEAGVDVTQGAAHGPHVLVPGHTAPMALS
jgi:hypothetical protein